MATKLCQSKICVSATSCKSKTEKKGRLTIQCDELWSFVDNKGNKKWVWLALDVDTRETVGVYIGDRDEVAARKVELIKGVNNLPLCFLFAPIELIVSLSKLLTLP